MRIAGLASSIPTRRLSAEEIIVAAGGRPAEARAFSKLFGIESVAALEVSGSPKDEFAGLLARLHRGTADKKPDTVIYVHGAPASPEDGEHPVLSLLGSHGLLDEVRLFYEVDQHNCAGLFWGLDLARVCLYEGVSTRVLILAGDALSSRVHARRYVPACTLIGDAFVGLVVDRGHGRVQLGEIALACRPEFAVGEPGRFYDAHDDMVLSMLATVGHSHDSEDLLPHNVNMFVWRRLCKAKDWRLSKLDLGLLPDVGHCYTTDPFLLLHRKLATARDVAPCVVLSMGLGAYVGACRVIAAEDFIACIL